MCGIVGLMDTRERRPFARSLLQRLNDTQFSRGPDEEGVHLEPGLALGHRRLSIIDLSSGQQPLFNEDGSVVVVFNGEIYNFQSLAAELAALGHAFRTRSDTEVIVHAWEAWGERCVDRFRGMFAFALWDRNQEALFLARDRLGVKPLHYALLPSGVFVFGSELKSLLAHPESPREIDPFAVEDYFALGYVPDPRTIYKFARKLPPAHTLLLRRGQQVPRPREYWDVQFTLDNRLSESDACSELLERLRESVQMRMIAEVPLGAFLSGGVDSSAVVATMAGVSDGPVSTCSIGFAETTHDESHFAREVAARYRTRHFVEQVDPDDFSLMDALAQLYDEPFADSSALPTYRVCELARRHVTVALSGDGGDESFAGYRRYATYAREQRLRSRCPEPLRRGLISPLAAVYPELTRAPRVLRAKAMLVALSRDPVEAYFEEMCVMRSLVRRSLFSSSLSAQLGDYSALQVFVHHARRAPDDPVAMMQYLDYKTYLPGDINTKVDRASMAHSLEVREPLMDHVLVEWLATLPTELKLRGAQGKHLLKRAFEPALPHEVLYRRKMGFAVPLAAWFRGPLRERVESSLMGERLAETGFFDRRRLSEMVESHTSGARDWSGAIWALLMFDAFLASSSGASSGVASRPGHRKFGTA